MSAAADVRPALIGHLKDLHLPTVRECYEDTARRAERETLSYEQYLLEVISRECEQRRKSKVQRLLKDSALPLEKSLQNFDLKRLPAKAIRQFRTLLEGSFVTQYALHQMRFAYAGLTGRHAGPGVAPGYNTTGSL